MRTVAVSVVAGLVEQLATTIAGQGAWGARWVESGDEQLMIQMLVDEGAEPAAQALLEGVLEDDVPLGPEFPGLALRVLEPHEADQAAESDRLGLDTVRADHATGQVQVISREFD